MGLQTPADIAILNFVLNVTRNYTAEKQKYTRVTGIQQGQALPGMLILQHMSCSLTGHQFMAEQLIISPRKQPYTGKNNNQIAGKGSYLATRDLRHRNGQVI